MIRLITALWHVVGLLLLVLLFAEFGIDWLRQGLRRLRYGRPTKSRRAATADAYGGADWTIAYYDEYDRNVRVDFVPYVGWWQRPFRGTYVTIDERGLRATPGEIEAPADAVRIYCFGGSTMMGMGARDDHTIAAELARGLRERGYTVAVTNFGQLAHNSTQEAIALHEALKLGERPDIAIFFDGLNDVVSAEHTGLPNRILHESFRRAEFNLLSIERRKDVIQAALLRAIPRTVRRLRKLTGLALAGPIPSEEVALARDNFPELARRVMTAYCGNLRLVRLLGQSYGFQTLFFWQPVITTKRVKSADEQFFEAEFTDDIELRRRLYAEVTAAYRAHPELRAAPDVIDLSRLFDDRSDPVYVDPYHVSEAGNAEVAAAMLPAIVAQVSALRRPATQGLPGAA